MSKAGLIFSLTDAVMVKTPHGSQWPSCVRLARCAALHALCLAGTSGLLEVHYSLGCMSWLPRPAVLFLSSQASRQTAGTRRMRKTDRSRDRQMGRFHLSSRPPNGHPPRSCVIYARRALALFFFPVSALGSGDLLEWVLSASKTSQWK